MPEQNTSENLRLWLRSCPQISPAARFCVDNMGSDADQYAIYSTPSPLITKTDILGGVYPATEQELNYIFAARLPYSLDTAQNLENLGFFAKVMEWVCEQNITKTFPELTEGTATSIMPTLSPHVFTATENTARYQIHLKIKYRRKPNG